VLLLNFINIGIKFLNYFLCIKLF